MAGELPGDVAHTAFEQWCTDNDGKFDDNHPADLACEFDTGDTVVIRARGSLERVWVNQSHRGRGVSISERDEYGVNLGARQMITTGLGTDRYGGQVISDFTLPDTMHGESLVFRDKSSNQVVVSPPDGDEFAP